MNRKILFIVLFVLAPISLVGQEDISTSNEINPIIGNWKIDLRPTPESEGYFQSFVVKTANEKSFSGTFYGSDIKNALINNNWPKTYFAFSTSDQSNQYYHSGYIDNDKLFGLTYCPNREFTAPWTGIKE
jgi:hypothetical protein